MKFHQPGPSSLSTLDLNANVNIGRRHRRRTGDDISSSVLRTGELIKGIKLQYHICQDIFEKLLKVELNTITLNTIYRLNIITLKLICVASSLASSFVAFDASVTGFRIDDTLPQCSHFQSNDLQ